MRFLLQNRHHIFGVLILSSVLGITACSVDDADQAIDSLTPPAPDPNSYIINGKITQSDNSPIENATIYVTINDKFYQTQTSKNGTYSLSLPKNIDYPTFFAGTIKKDGFKPSTVQFNYSNGNISSISNSTDARLEVKTESDIIIDSGLNIIHLGDDNFSGSVNSQLQVASKVMPVS